MNLLADLNQADVAKLNLKDSDGNPVEIDTEPCIIKRLRGTLLNMPEKFVNYPERAEKWAIHPYYFSLFDRRKYEIVEDDSDSL